MGGTQGRIKMSISGSIVKGVKKAFTKPKPRQLSKAAAAKLTKLTRGQSARDLATLAPKVLRELQASAKKAADDALGGVQADVMRKLQAKISAALKQSSKFQDMLKKSIKSETDPRFNKGGSIAKGKK